MLASMLPVGDGKAAAKRKCSHPLRGSPQRRRWLQPREGTNPSHGSPEHRSASLMPSDPRRRHRIASFRGHDAARTNAGVPSHKQPCVLKKAACCVKATGLDGGEIRPGARTNVHHVIAYMRTPPPAQPAAAPPAGAAAAQGPRPAPPFTMAAGMGRPPTAPKPERGPVKTIGRRPGAPARGWAASRRAKPSASTSRAPR